MKSAKIFTNDFNRLIETTKNFVSVNSTKPSFNFIKLEFYGKENKVTAIAVDGFRMSVENTIISDCEEDFVCYVKPNIKMPSGCFATINLNEETKEAVIKCNGFSFGYDQPIAEEFNWRNAFPKTEVKYKIGFNGNYLLQALQAAKASCGGFRKPVVLEFRSNLEPILLRTNNEDIKMVLPVRFKED